MRRTRHAARLTSAFVTLSVLAACSTAADPDLEPTPPEPTQTATATVDPSVEMPDSPVGDQAQWVLDQLAADTGPTSAETAAHVSASFLVEVPAARLAVVFGELRTSGPWTAVDVDAVADDAVVRLHDGSGEPWRMSVSVDPAGAITALLVKPDLGGDRTPATTWAEVHEQLTALDAGVSLLAARVTPDGQCEPITAIDADETRPMASIFKLYVLGALADTVDQGWARWSDLLTVTDDVRSLPSGQLQDQPNGTQVSVSQTAAGMIAVSDNTAADMIMALVGEQAVQAAVAEMGHSDPDVNDPFLTTRQFFTIGWGPDDLPDDWRRADTDERRAMVEAVPAGPLSVTGGDVDRPAWPAGVDWFGSAEDICAAQVALNDRPLDDPDTQMLRTILGHNRGVTIDEATWPYVSFKGGSAPGVLSGSWFGERADGERFFFAMQAAAKDEQALAARSDFFDLAEDAFALLAGE